MMRLGKRIEALILTAVILLGAMPVHAETAEEEICQHQYEAEVTAPTCGVGGYTTYRCTLCQDTYMAEETAPLGGCELEPVAQKDATCTAEGTAAHYICKNCDTQYHDEEGMLPVEDPVELVLPITGCKPEAVPQVDATCTAEGTAAHYKCNICGKLYEDDAATLEITDPAQLVLPIAGCKPEAVPQVDATCTAEGTAAHYKCNICGKLYEDEAAAKEITDPTQLQLPKAAHTYGAWEITDYATSVQEGSKTRACEKCGHSETAQIPKLKLGLSTPSVKIKQGSSSGKPYLSWSEVRSAKAYQVFLVDTQTGEKTLLTQTTARKYTYQDAQVGERYTFTVAAVNATRSSKECSANSVICRCRKPVVKVSREPASGKPILSWQAVEGAVSYRVYRSTKSSSGYKCIATTQELSFTDTSATANRTYYYRVKAVGPNSDSNSAYSSKLKHTCDCPYPVVTSVTSGSSKGIKLSWKKASGAKTYYVYRASQENGPYTRIAKTKSLSYTDTKAPANQISYYKVRCYGSSASLSAYSPAVSYMNHTFRAWETVTPNTPEGTGLKQRVCSVCGHVEEKVTPKLKRTLSTPSVKIKQGSISGKPYLSWSKVRSATAYQIYLVDAQTGERTFLTETTSRYYSHKDALVGERYSFTVVAVNSSRCSRYSAKKSVVCRCATPELNLKPDPDSGKPILSWQAVGGAVSYRVYRSTKSSSGYKCIATTTELSVMAQTSVAGKTYYYRVQAVGPNSDSNSAKSDKIKQVCDCARPVPTAENGPSKGIRVSWKKVSGAKNYYVYRASQENGPYTRIAQTKALYYTDTKAPANQISYYKVRAYGVSASLSAYSLPVSCINHTFGSWTLLKERTPFEEGYRERVCSGCGYAQGQSLPVLPKDLSTPSLCLTSANSSGKLTLSWKKISNAKAYWIFLVDNQTDTYTYLTNTTSHSYIYDGQPGTQGSFAVMAVGESACSDYSAVRTGKARMASTRITCEEDETTGIPVMKWNAVEGAAGYGVYRSTVSNSGYSLYTTTDGCSVTTEGETPGVEYFYRVKVLHASDREADSIFSNICSSNTTSETLQIHAGRISNVCNKVVWKPVEGAEEYEIYRASSADGSFSKVGAVKGETYTEWISSGRVYYYQVRATDENGDTLGDWSNIASAEDACQVPLKVYISPSCQTRNLYVYGDTTEAVQCRKIAKLVVPALERCGIVAVTNVTDDMDERMAESNDWNADLHVPIHTNASGCGAMGTQIYHNGGGLSSRAARQIMDVLAPLTPGSGADSVRAYKTLYEIRRSYAPTAYIEVAFHDTRTEAKWIIRNTDVIAEAICQGICNTYGIPYVAP